MTPTLSLITRVIIARFDQTEAALRLSQTDEAHAARMAVAWVAEQVTEADRATIALWLGQPFGAVAELLALAEAERAASPVFAERLDELAMTCAAEAASRDRLGLLRPDRDLRSVAIAAIQRRGVVSEAEIRALAAAWLSCQAERAAPIAPPARPGTALAAAQAVVAALTRLQTSEWSPRERADREVLSAAMKSLHALTKETTDVHA